MTPPRSDRGELPGNRNRSWFWPFFWITLLALLGVYLYAELKVGKLSTNAQGRLTLAPHAVPRWDSIIGAILARHDIRLNETTFGEIDALIDTEIDKAFEPVYGQITKLADFHYSVAGEYTELGAAAMGNLADTVGRILFREVELEKRLEAGIGKVFAVSSESISDSMRHLNRELGSRMELTPEEMQLLAPALELTLEDMEARFGESSLALRGAGAAGGAAAGGLAAKATGKKVAGKLAGKATIKAGVTAAKIIGGGAAGAAAGSVVPGVGTALGGVIGAVSVWLATDKLLVEADEYLHREKFEADMAALIDSEKARIKDELRDGYGAYLSNLADLTRERLEGLRPVDLIDR
jgi:hypothetical protein